MTKFRTVATFSVIGYLAALALGVFAAAPAGAPPAAPGGRMGRNAQPVDNTPRTLSPYFAPAAAGSKAPDAEGFLQRWMLLEPIPQQNLRTNAIFTEAYIRNAFKSQNFPEGFAKFPKAGEKVTVGNDELAWHALDSNLFNVKLFRFSYGLNKPIYGVMFFATTVVDSPRDMENVRLAVGSNSASMWWLNGKEAVTLFGDRRMVMDDGVSKRITLKKGPNIIQGAVINGPGMSDFCVRFIDDQGQPIKDLSINFDAAGK